MSSDLAPENGRSARRLIRQAASASLATLARAGSPAEGFPYASLVLVASDHDGAPLLLISALAEHTRNMAADRRVALLFDGTAGLADPLEGARLSLLGEASPAEAPAQRARFLARHPSAAAYAGFADFSLVRIEPRRAHLVAGFGRIVALEPADLLTGVADAGGLLAAEESAVAHMNADHADALALYATRLLGAPEGAWRATGADPDGLDLRAGAARARLPFPHRVTTGAALREALVALAREARARPA